MKEQKNLIYNIFLNDDIPNIINWNTLSGKPSSFTPSSHTHDDRYYTESEINGKFGAVIKIRDVGLAPQTISSPGNAVYQIDSFYAEWSGYTLISSNVISAYGSYCTYVVFGQILWSGMGKVYLPVYNPLNGGSISVSVTVRFTFIKNDYKSS